MLLKSLFCLHGRDSRLRFAVISVGVYLSIAFAGIAFGANFLTYLLTLLGLPLLAFSALRRLTDANKPKALVVIFILPLLVLLALLMVAAPPILVLLGVFLGFGATFLGARLLSPTLVDYRVGYYGPAIAMPISQAIPRRRVEPVIEHKVAEPKVAETHITESNVAPSSVIFAEEAMAVADELAENRALTESHAVANEAKQVKTPFVDAPLPRLDAQYEVLKAQLSASQRAEFEALRDELRFDALTELTQNPADFVVPDVGHAATQGGANSPLAEQPAFTASRSDIAEEDLTYAQRGDAEAIPFASEPFESTARSDEPVWRIDAGDETFHAEQSEHAEELRRRRTEAKESGSVTELFRGMVEFVVPYRRYLKKPKLPTLSRRHWQGAAGVLGGLVLMLLVWGLWPQTEVSIVEAPIVTAVPSAPPSSNRETLDMPDGFSVALEQDVLILRWLGERGQAHNLWSIATAKGDKSCSALMFNNGSAYRTVTVDLHADSATEARFSPLDTADIIADLARRSSIDLCGYKFSLKGSQAVLEPSRSFGGYLAR